MTISEIQHTIDTQWQAFRSCYDTVLQSPVALLNAINSHLANANGKHLRPLLLLLAAGATHNSDANVPQLAAAVELLHNASLMHDDVVDGDDTRRGAASVQHKWNIHVALLAGDYYLARMMHLLHKIDNPSATQTVIETATAMSEGELLQQQVLLQPPAQPDTDMYLQIIRLKTARLIQACCVLGAGKGAATPQRAMEQFGAAYGMAFQLRDDLDDRHKETAPWIPDGNCLRRALAEQCRQARSALQALEPSTHRNALEQLIKFIEI